MSGKGNTDAARMWLKADVYSAAYGTAAPTDLTTDLTTLGYSLVGLIGQDEGISRTFSSDDTDKFAYGSILTRRTSVKEKVQFGFTAWEDSDLVYKLAHPGSVTSTAGGLTTRVKYGRNLGKAIKALVLELQDGDIHKRIWIPRGQVLLTGDNPIKDNEIAGYPLTVDALGATVAGYSEPVFYKELTDDVNAAASGS